ncbi:MAG: bifunctional (p)ppGpp synthetase/guanosine-3',5'-bis(diphosphate) 3'-pyrophosphohydrolase [Dehalococcoidia bacterium]|nr:bifunctional (p)ppGpp synthetase/guanosine-3',5'-bis(diphosphate) 3'-pyrophosphohydrolase [Dehalococcoidia bacterium]
MERTKDALARDKGRTASPKVDVQELLTKVREYLPPEKVQVIEEAYAYAARCHEGQMRESGEPYIVHPLSTAILLAELQLDASTITAALLHDVIEDCGVSQEDIAGRFGDEVGKLVDGATKVSKIELQLLEKRQGAQRTPEGERVQAESLRKMLVAMAEDVRVVLIKLADRLHNMRTLDALPEERRKRIARETLDVFAPLAHRLGIWQFKWQLEDLALRHLEPDKYHEISRFLAAKRGERERYIQGVMVTLRKELEKAGIKAEVSGRPKGIYSIYEKREKYAAQGKDISQIYDLFAVRVLVEDVKDCYAALGIVHTLWHPLPGQLDDYIGNPKENMYQSLHTTVMCQGSPVEVQIRTNKMHRLAEYGVAAHWRYKEAGVSREDMKFEEKMTWLRQLLEWQREVTGTEEFLESVRTDILHDQVFVYTPKGDIVELPAGSTPLDFAYRIHTDLGHRCVGAKVNGKLVSLNTQLQNGNTVEVVVSKIARGPSLDWLNQDLGFVHTTSAREKVRLWFRKQERTVNVQRGREALQKELHRLAVTISEDEVAALLKFDSADDLLAAIGCGNISLQQIATKVGPQEPEPPQITPPPAHAAPAPLTDVTVMGVGDLLTRVANCCHPLPGDDIVGFITRTRGVTVHRRDCTNVLNVDETERIVPVQWGPTKQVYPVRVRVEAWDRVGLLRDLSNVLADEKVNIVGLQSIEHSDGAITISMTLHTSGIQQLSRLFAKMETVKSVLSAQRSNSGA